MKFTPPPAELTSSLRWLAKELRRLKPEQGRLARKNAREGALTQLRRLRNLMDQHFPPIAKVNPKLERLLNTPAPWERKKVQRTPAQVMAVFKSKMERRDYAPVPETHLALAIAKAGVRLVDPPQRTASAVPYAPNWAIVGAKHNQRELGGVYNIGKVKELRKSVTARKALLAAHRLGAGP
jgi:hypothetical protein